MGPMDRSSYRQTRRFWASSRSVAVALSLAMALLLIVTGGCTGRSGEEPAKSARNELRIISFSPALSRMVVDLGLGDRIVGRTPYSGFLDDSVAVVGDLQRVDYERVLDLRPTHILIQAPRDGADERLLRMADEHDWIVGQWTALNTIEDIESVLREMPGVLCESGSAQHAALARRSAELLNEIALALTPGGGELWRGSTLLVFRLEPVGVYGRHTYLSDVLHRLGAENAVRSDGWSELTLEDVARLNPPAIICIRSNADPDADLIDAIGSIGNLDIDAVRDRRVGLLTDPAALLPSTSIIETAKQVRAILQSWGGAGASTDGEDS